MLCFRFQKAFFTVDPDRLLSVLFAICGVLDKEYCMYHCPYCSFVDLHSFYPYWYPFDDDDRHDYSGVHRYRCCELRKWTEQWSAVEQQRAAARAEPMALPMHLGCRRVFILFGNSGA